MTGWRHHLLALVTAALALAVGFGIGGSTLVTQAAGRQAAREARLVDSQAALRARVAALERRARVDAEVVEALAGPVTTGRLAQRQVLVVATPTARPALVRRVRASVRAAGAGVTGVLRLARTYVDPANATAPLEDLALQLVPPGVRFDAGASSIERVDVVLARASVRPASDADPDELDGVDPDAAEVIAGFEALGAIRLAGEPGRRADLAVVVSGSPEAQPARAALLGLVAALDAGGSGVVVAGADATRGLLRWVRGGAGRGRVADEASSVDSVHTIGGRVGLVLALAEQAAGRSGHYGIGSGADGVLPVGLPPVGDAG